MKPLTKSWFRSFTTRCGMKKTPHRMRSTLKPSVRSKLSAISAKHSLSGSRGRTRPRHGTRVTAALQAAKRTSPRGGRGRRGARSASLEIRSVDREAVEHACAARRRQALHRAPLRRMNRVPRVHAGIAPQPIRMAEHRAGVVRAGRPVVARELVPGAVLVRAGEDVVLERLRDRRGRIACEIVRRFAFLVQGRLAGDVIVAVQLLEVLCDQLALRVVPGPGADAVAGI